MRLPSRIAELAALVILGLAGIADAATLVIVNADGAGEGFNDPTVVAPVGGNPGTTRGQQRLNVFQRAATIWGGILSSNITIRINAKFDPLACDATSAVLGSAGAVDVQANFPGAEFLDTWYPIALANKIANTDLSPNADISARFNSALDDNSACLGGIGWYYGYDHNEGNQVDLLPVVLHELGHGLGFQTFVTLTSGTLLSGLPDVYARNIRDTSTNKLWTQMTNGERVASAINTGNVVWDGVSVRGHVPSFLGPRPIVQINAPPAIAGAYAAGTATFGAALTTGGLTGDVVLVNDGTGTTSDACEALVNGAQVVGRIALIDRGTCTFTIKAKNAQNAGAIGVIIANNVAGSVPPGLGGSDPTITIPVVSVTQAAGNSIKNELGLGHTVNATLKLDPTQLAGADTHNRVYLYAPNPLQLGSSISHFDVSASPNLLMEPAVSSDLTDSVDLTRYLFEDIGWFGPTSGIAEGGPRATRLLGNAPNPFNPTTVIRFELADAAAVELDVYDLAGRLVKHLLDANLQRGVHPVPWDGTDARGRRVASGVYVYRLETPDHAESQRMVLIK